MTVPMIRVIASIEGDYSLSQLNTAMDDWVSAQSEWVGDPQEHHITEPLNEERTAPRGYRDGTYRFLIEDAKDNLLQKCEDKLVNKVDWYRLGYHQCSNDSETLVDCTWEEQREWTDKDVTIPDNVPVFVESE